MVRVSSWKWNESESLEISCLRRTDWSASCSLATIQASTVMSFPAYECYSLQIVPAGVIDKALATRTKPLARDYRAVFEPKDNDPCIGDRFSRCCDPPIGSALGTAPGITNHDTRPAATT